LEETGGARGGEGEDCQGEGEREEYQPFEESEQVEEQEFFEESEFEQVEESLSCDFARCWKTSGFLKGGSQAVRCGGTLHALAEKEIVAQHDWPGSRHLLYPSEHLDMEADVFVAPVTRQHPQYKAWSVHDMERGDDLAQTSPPCHAHHLYDTGTAQRRKYAQMAPEGFPKPGRRYDTNLLQSWGALSSDAGCEKSLLAMQSRIECDLRLLIHWRESAAH
jgi:hypothetical protein